MSPSFSPCSLACFGYDITVEAGLIWVDCFGNRWGGHQLRQLYALLIKLISLCKGIIYLLIATATEVTQVVRPASPHLRLHSPLTISIIRCRCSFVWI